MYTRISFAPDFQLVARPWASTTGLMKIEGVSVAETELSHALERVLDALRGMGYVEARFDGPVEKSMRIDQENRIIVIRGVLDSIFTRRLRECGTSPRVVVRITSPCNPEEA